MSIFKKAAGKKSGTNPTLLLMCLPGILFFLVFSYIPMFGLVLAFKDFTVGNGFLDGLVHSRWVGLENFRYLFTSTDAWRITRNTIGLNFIFIVTEAVFAVGFAIMLNEIGRRILVKAYQTIFFFPYFLSWVVAGYMLYAFLNPKYGIVNGMLTSLGMEGIDWYSKPGHWPYILTLAYIWKGVGYFSVVYYAGLMGIENEYYEAAAIDGATKPQLIFRVTLPMLAPIITIVVLLQLGKIFYADFGLFYFLPMNVGALQPTTDVIDTYVYRTLAVTGDLGMSAASGFYQSIVGFFLVLVSNAIVRKYERGSALF